MEGAWMSQRYGCIQESYADLFFFCQSTPTVTSVSPSCTLPRKTNTVTSPPPSAGRPSRPPRPSCYPSSLCSRAPMTRVRRMWRLPACGVRTLPSSRSACVGACVRAWARSKRGILRFFFLFHFGASGWSFSFRFAPRVGVSGVLRARGVALHCMIKRGVFYEWNDLAFMAAR